VQLLLATGKVDVDSKDITGHTPLSWAAKVGHEAVVQLCQSCRALSLSSISAQPPP
jgi:ankyrin repeat protein